MARTVIRVSVPANSRAPNVLANSAFQFADTPGPNGIVGVRIAATSDVAQNQMELKADKDFVSLDELTASVAPPALDSNPGQEFNVEPGTQLNVDLINNNVGAQFFNVLVDTVPL